LEDPLAQSLEEFTNFIEVKKDALGISWCTGSGVVFRRSVITEIGGWPVTSLCEDVLCSLKMISKGYKTAYLHERLQVGLVPETLAGRKF
jgi:cellulose synthase/poly-beta-1,6-N-acetylglucosamine synthase-like glycosyltransferase